MDNLARAEALHLAGNLISVRVNSYDFWKGWVTYQELAEKRALADELYLLRDRLWRERRQLIR